MKEKKKEQKRRKCFYNTNKSIKTVGLYGYIDINTYANYTKIKKF